MPRPAGMSDDEDDSDEFELLTSCDRNEGYKQKICLEQTPESKETIFHTSLKNKDVEKMEKLLAEGFHIDQPLSGGWSALMYACSLGSLTMVEFLIKKRANVNFNKDLFTPLMALCKSSSSDEEELSKCMDILLKHGANIDAMDRFASTALMNACSSGHVGLVNKLVSCKCDVNIQDSEGWSALFHAVNEAREDILCVLLEGKARLDLIDRRKRSAYDVAVVKGYHHLGKLVMCRRERRKLEEEEKEKMLEPKALAKNPVDELLSQLPKAHAKSTSGFSKDVNKLLWSMGLRNYVKHFEAQNVQLNELLLTTDDRLKELGVRFSVHRQRILNSLRKFHLHQWNKASIGIKQRNQQMDVQDAVKLMCNVTKHLHILSATLNYVHSYQPAPISPDVFRFSESAMHQLNLIRNELSALQSFACCLHKKDKPEPVDLIKPVSRKERSYFSIVATTVFIGIVVWRKQIILSLSNKLNFLFD